MGDFILTGHYVDINFNNETTRMSWPVNDIETLKVISKEWEEHSNKYLSRLKTKRTVIQAGGHCGLYAKIYVNLFERVFTFEPELNNFTHLTNNCNDTRIVKLNAALSDENDFVSMGIVSYINTGMHKVLPKGIFGLIAYGITLDSIKPKDVDLIHLDVEGYEYNALKGAVKTISKYKPLIVLEMTEKTDKIYALMKKLGYEEVEVYITMSKNSIFEYKG